MTLPTISPFLAILMLSQTVAANQLLASPLFGNSLGGDPFDDGAASVVPPVARLHALRICYGDMVDGIQLFYTLEGNHNFAAPPHGTVSKQCGKDSNSSKIVFKENEVLVHIEGLMQIKWQYVSQLTLFTSVGGGPPKLRGGPFGRGAITDVPFSVTGDIRGIFGRAGDVLDSIGFYINSTVPLSSYQKEDWIGGKGGYDFDDFDILTSKNLKPLKITSMVISYGVIINAIQVTYAVSNGNSITLTHGTLNTDNWLAKKYFEVLDFDDDEWITKVNASPRISEAVEAVGYLEIETTNSKGSVRSYGPYGELFLANITTIAGVVHGFYGHSTDYLAINSLGFYT